jgi:predicted nuclease with TOPRIM domain
MWERYNMNITDFFVELEQWNWDAINTISNIILVGVLVCITWQYAKQVKKQTESMEKDRQKNRILEGIQHVLSPCIHGFKKEINEITNGTRTHFGQHFNIFFDRKTYFSYAFWDIIEEFTDLPEKLRANDELADKLNILYTKIEKEVTDKFESDKFNERLTDMVNSFNRSNSDALGTETRALFVLKNICKEYIISEWDLSNNVPRVSEHGNNFLKENKDELQRYKDLPIIKKLRKEIKETLNELKKSNEDILEQFEKIITKHRKDYGFTEDDMNPDIKKERDFFK